MKKLFVVLILIIGISCSDDSINSPTLDSATENLNILTFKDAEDLNASVRDVKNIKSNNSSFVSFNDIYNKAIEELSATETEETHNKLLKAYSDVVSFSENTYSPVISNTIYKNIINRDRMYISGEYVHKVIDNQFIVFTETKNLDGLKAISSVDKLNDKIFKVIQYQDHAEIGSGRTQASCGANVKKDYFANASNCRNDRRVWVRAYTYYAISGDNYTPWVISEAWGELRTGTWCNWKGYSTRLSTQSCSFTVRLVINGVTVEYIRTFDDYAGTTDEPDHLIINSALIDSPILWQGGTLPTIEFWAIHEEANSRGVGAGNWAVIDCAY